MSAIKSLFKANGPQITASLVTRRRLDIYGALADVGGPDPDLIFPMRTKNGTTVIIYL